ncbi:MAG TPA: hypothetical protein DCP38_17440 [Acidobacteria bacterium]|nr:hypothetical protein [Acidobacteriota bacterium]
MSTRAAAVVLLTLAATAPHAGAQNGPAPAGVIVFIADDQDGRDAGVYGNPAIRTPNIDRLAAAGVRFDRAFLTTSSCSPSRSSILTGRYPHSTAAAGRSDDDRPAAGRRRCLHRVDRQVAPRRCGACELGDDCRGPRCGPRGPDARGLRASAD